MTVSWSLMLLERLSVEDVYFTEDTQGTDDCGLQMIASQGTLLSSYDQCGFTATHHEYSSVYESKITVVLKDGRSREVGYFNFILEFPLILSVCMWMQGRSYNVYNCIVECRKI